MSCDSFPIVFALLQSVPQVSKPASANNAGSPFCAFGLTLERPPGPWAPTCIVAFSSGSSRSYGATDVRHLNYITQMLRNS